MTPTPSDSRALDLGLRDADFWTIDLRLGVYHSWTALADDERWRVDQIARLFPTRRHLDALAVALSVSADGRIDDVQRRLAEDGPKLLPWLLVAQFAARKHPKAVEHAARLVVGDEAASLRGKQDIDRVLAMVAIARRDPDALQWVRGLQHWQTKGMARLALVSRVGERRRSVQESLSPARVQDAIAEVQGRSGPRPQFEMVVPMADGSQLLVLRRNHRPNHNWDDGCVRIHHGHDEELIVLHIAEDGRSVGVSGTTIELPRKIAEVVASGWFGEAVRFSDVVETAKPESVKRMLSALANGQVAELTLVELGARNTPFAGSPEITLKVSSQDLGPTLAEFRALGRPLAVTPEDVVFIRVRFGARCVLIDFPKQGDDVIVRFADGRLDKDEARALQELLDRHFAIKPVSSEAKVA
jgi:hypothetical protein